MNTLALGDDVATGLGVNVTVVRGLAALSGVLLCAAVTALAGPISFIGLMVPHLIRALVGPDLKKIMPLSAVCGACVLLISDVLGRIWGSPGELESGIVTALIGGPVLFLSYERSGYALYNEKNTIWSGYYKRKKRYWFTACILLSLVILLACIMMVYGNTIYMPGTVLEVLKGNETKGAAFTIKTLRLPRMLAAIFCGAAFGLAGNTFQKLLGNPLASPDIIGVTSGASVAAVLEFSC